MNKMLFLGAATLVASCSQNISDSPVSTNNEITFSHLNSRITRTDGFRDGANDNKDDYKVYAAISQKSTGFDPLPEPLPTEYTNWYFEDDVYGKTSVSGTANTPKKGPYYWLSTNAALNFYAYAPASVVATGSPDDGLTIEYTVKENADEDLTIANPVENMTFEKTKGTGLINFQFFHVLSKIVISAQLSPELTKAGYTIEPNYTASLTMKCKSGFITPTTIDKQWSIPQANRIEATYTGRTSYMVLPQNVEGNSIQLNGVVIKKNGIQVFPSELAKGKSLKKIILKESDVINGAKDNAGDKTKNDGTFIPGKQYNFKIVINDLSFDENGNPIFGKVITFNAEVADWSEEGTKL